MSEPTELPFSNFKLFIVFFLLKCRFSRPKKYFVFFSPSLYQRVLDLIIEPFVLYSISFSNSCLYPSSCIVRVSRSTSVMLSSKPFCRFAILDSKSTYLLFICFFLFSIYDRASSDFHFNYFPEQDIVYFTVIFVLLRHI